MPEPFSSLLMPTTDLQPVETTQLWKVDTSAFFDSTSTHQSRQETSADSENPPRMELGAAERPITWESGMHTHRTHFGQATPFVSQEAEDSSFRRRGRSYELEDCAGTRLRATTSTFLCPTCPWLPQTSQAAKILAQSRAYRRPCRPYQTASF